MQTRYTLVIRRGTVTPFVKNITFYSVTYWDKEIEVKSLEMAYLYKMRNLLVGGIDIKV